jgi:hypothetical protein
MTEKTEFLPFHAINEFMRPDFRLNIIRDTLSSQQISDEPCLNNLNKQIKKSVKIPGFRNSDKAPALVKVLPTSKAFENNPDLVGALLYCWSEIHADLRTEVFNLLSSRNWPIFNGTDLSGIASLSTDFIKEWPILPLEFDRAKLPGFYIHWPKGEDFEILYDNFAKLYPESDASKDKVSLMVVWITMRLPYEVDIEMINTNNNIDVNDPQ